MFQPDWNPEYLRRKVVSYNNHDVYARARSLRPLDGEFLSIWRMYWFHHPFPGWSWHNIRREEPRLGRGLFFAPAARQINWSHSRSWLVEKVCVRFPYLLRSVPKLIQKVSFEKYLRCIFLTVFYILRLGFTMIIITLVISWNVNLITMLLFMTIKINGTFI